MNKDPLIFLEHILESIANIEVFMKDVSDSSFKKNIEKQSAVIPQIEIIGEAVRVLPQDFRKKYSEVCIFNSFISFKQFGEGVGIL